MTDYRYEVSCPRTDCDGEVVVKFPSVEGKHTRQSPCRECMAEYEFTRTDWYSVSGNPPTLSMKMEVQSLATDAEQDNE